jgi:myo-inositol 2-dehydrogenase/D-chiro-inositol 1-dehydrogenase
MAVSEQVTIYDVAARAGVSASTVSHVINRTRNVAGLTRQKVERAIAALAYQPNDAARMLREGKAKLIGVVMPDISNAYFADLIHRLEMLAYELGARVLTCNSDYDCARERSYIDDLVRRRVDGIIVAPVAPDRAFEADMRRTGLPVVLIDRVWDKGKLPSVSIDNAAGAALAAEHLFALGHRRIGCITSASGVVESADQRTRGFIDKLRALGVKVERDAIQRADFRIAGGMEAAQRLLAARPDLTAIFCANDQMAMGALRAAKAAQRKVPDDLSVVGFDDSPEARLCDPPLTTIAQPVEALAERAMALLRGKDEAKTMIRLPARLAQRQSTGPAPRSNPTGKAGPEKPASPKVAKTRQGEGPKRILVLGAGRIGQVHARALSQIPGSDIAGICDPDPVRAGELAAKYGLSAFSDPLAAIAAGGVDGVIVGSSSDTHLDMVRLAARHGLHIFCEKPLALTTPDIKAAIRECAEAGVALQVGFNRRFDPDVVAIANAIHSGQIGKPLSLRIVSRDPSPPPRAFVRTSGGMFHDMSIHDFDLARHLFGEEIVEVMAMGSCLIDPMFAEENDFDVTSTMLRFASGAIGVVENTRATPYGYDQRVEVLGIKGAMESENLSANRVIRRDASGQTTPVALPHFLERYETAFRRQIESFVRAISTSDPQGAIAVTGTDALHAHLIAEAVAQSCRAGQPIKVEKPGPDAK